MRGYAKLLGRHNIRINTVHPMGVATPMIQNDEFKAYHASHTEVIETSPRLLPISFLEPQDVSRKRYWLSGAKGLPCTTTMRLPAAVRSLRVGAAATNARSA